MRCADSSGVQGVLQVLFPACKNWFAGLSRLADNYLRPTLGYNTGSSQDLMQSLDCKSRTQNLSHLFKSLDTIHVQAGHFSQFTLREPRHRARCC
jgi:hypothetical protein